jgi:hypothetical protein
MENKSEVLKRNSRDRSSASWACLIEGNTALYVIGRHRAASRDLFPPASLGPVLRLNNQVKLIRPTVTSLNGFHHIPAIRYATARSSQYPLYR